jgi:hypothetical protein
MYSSKIYRKGNRSPRTSLYLFVAALLQAKFVESVLYIWILMLGDSIFKFVERM